MRGTERKRRGYHHGDLRVALKRNDVYFDRAVLAPLAAA